jgi:hypothetical protein
MRGLENYMTWSKELCRRRDQYKIALSRNFYDSECLSGVALEHAYLHAFRDDAGTIGKQEVLSHRQFRRTSTFLPGSPVSVLQSGKRILPTFERVNTTPSGASIRDMNKRLIEDHLNGNSYKNHSFDGSIPVMNNRLTNDHLNENRCAYPPPFKKQRCRPPTVSSKQVIDLTCETITSTQQCHSDSFSASGRRQPERRFSHLQDKLRNQSLKEEYDQQMTANNRLINDFPLVDDIWYRWYMLKHGLASGIDTDQFMNENMSYTHAMHPKIHRDLVYSHHTSNMGSHISFQQGVPYLDCRSDFLGTLLREQELNASLDERYLQECSDFIEIYSRVRRDSLSAQCGSLRTPRAH